MPLNSWLSSLRASVFGPVRRRPVRHRPLAPRSRQGCRPALEYLEDRLALSASAAPLIAFNPVFGPETVTGSGSGMSNPTVNLVFQGQSWNDTNASPYASAVATILASPYLSGLTQYGADGNTTEGSAWIDSTSLANNPGGASLQSFLQSSIGANSTAPGVNDLQHAPIYIVVSDATTSGSTVSWNMPATYTDDVTPENIHMIWISSTALGSIDSFTLAVSHELANTISDPGGVNTSNLAGSNGVVIVTPNAPAGLLGADVPGNQIADYEPSAGGMSYGYRLDGVMVQPYWSDDDGAYIVPGQTWSSDQQRIVLNPIWNNTGSQSPTFGTSLGNGSNQPQYNLFALTPSSSTPAPTLSLNADLTQATLGTDTATFDAGAIVNTSTHVVTGNIANTYLDLSAETTGSGQFVQQTLGLPTSDEQTVYNTSNQAIGSVRHFEGGDIYWSTSLSQGNVLYGATLTEFNAEGVAAGFGLPVSDEADVANFSGLRVTNFLNGGRIYSSTAGSYIVYGSLLTTYNATANQTTVTGQNLQQDLGLPTSDSVYSGGQKTLTFENGGIYSSQFTGTHVLYDATETAYVNFGGPGSALGLPSSDTASVPGVANSYITHFQGGDILVTPSGQTHVVTGAPLALAKQTTTQLDQLFVATDGAVLERWVVGFGIWQGPIEIAPAGTAVPGTTIALIKYGTKLEAAFVNAAGTVEVMTAAGSGSWTAPVAATAAGVAPAGANLTFALQYTNLDLAFAGNDGAVHILWQNGNGPWHSPPARTLANVAVPGAPLAMCHQLNNLDLAFIGADGGVRLLWAYGDLPWHAAVRLGAAGVAPAGGSVSLANQQADLDLTFVDNNGAINLMYVAGYGAWHAARALTVAGIATPGAALTMGHQVLNLDVFFVNTSGAVQVLWVSGYGPWHGPGTLAPAGSAQSGARVALGLQGTDQLDLAFLDSDGTDRLMWVLGYGTWRGPVRL